FTYAAQLLLTFWCTQWLLRGRPIYTGERIVLLCNVVTIVLQSVQVGRTDTSESLLLLQSIFNLLAGPPASSGHDLQANDTR
ncbi:hypothetical protein CTI14_53855, partial [Methylobacterium radiotolerans]